MQCRITDARRVGEPSIASMKFSFPTALKSNYSLIIVHVVENQGFVDLAETEWRVGSGYDEPFIWFRFANGCRGSARVDYCDTNPEDVRDQVIPVLGLLQATKGHLRAGDILLRVFKVFELDIMSAISLSLGRHNKLLYQSFFLPFDPFRLVRIRVGEAFHLTRLTAEQAVEVWADLVSFSCTQSVALSASGLRPVSN